VELHQVREVLRCEYLKLHCKDPGHGSRALVSVGALLSAEVLTLASPRRCAPHDHV